MKMRSTINEIGPVLVCVSVMVWLITIFRTLGGVDADYGGFVSISERLLAGDRLYADVYENKDPLFHYFFASSRILTPLGSWFLNIVWMLVAAMSLWVAGRRLGLAEKSSFFLAGISAPILLTGASYFPSASHVPGIVMTLVAMASALASRWFIAGLALAAVAGLKLIMAPMALALVLAVLVYRRKASGVGKLAGGLAVGTLAITAALFLRGELLPYVDNLRLNTVYSQAAAGNAEGLASIRNHVERVFGESNQVTLVAIVLAVALAWALVASRPTQYPVVVFTVLAALGALAYSLVVIAITGLWGHHGLILVVPAFLALTSLLLALPISIATSTAHSLPVLFLFSWLLAGAPGPIAYLEPLEYTRANVHSHLTLGDEARAISQSGKPSTYMRVGNARDAGHAFGLREWTLACPRIFQEVWESKELLQPTLDCLPSANVILISKEVEQLVDFPDWSHYVAGVESLVADQYDCQETDAGRVCRRPGT